MFFLLAFLLYFLLVLFLSTFLFPMPINDQGVMRYRTVPWATITLITINTVIFLAWIAPEIYGPEALESEYGVTEQYIEKVTVYGYREVGLIEDTGIGAFATFSSMFMHADMWHLFANMVFLWSFGRRVEDACGSWRFAMFYLVAGMLANVGSVLFSLALDTTPSIGASGAIFGVVGAYLFLFPGAKVQCLWGLGVILRFPIALIRSLFRSDMELWRWTVTLPSWLVLIWYVIQSVVSSLRIMQGTDEMQGVNHLAHLAGFLGALTIFLFVRKDVLTRYMTGRAL